MALPVSLSNDILEDFLDSFYCFDTESVESRNDDNETAEDDLLDLYLDKDASGVYEFENGAYVGSESRVAKVGSCIERSNVRSDFFGDDDHSKRFVEKETTPPDSQDPVALEKVVATAFQHPQRSEDERTQETLIALAHVEL